ncbi:MAG: tRNA guanosine(34) transglycosylase Tgt [Candidatus Pacearchaeota archaeon]
MKILNLNNKRFKLPIFLPDATLGKIKYLTSRDLKKSGTEGVVVNIFHLLKNNLIKKIKREGIHEYMKFNGLIISDSGGFQIMSLLHKNPNLGKIEKDKVIFFIDKKRIILTPEECIRLQIKIKSDIIMCLDECTYPSYNYKKQKESVERTIFWARKCKKEFEKITKNKKERPLLFAIIQGGNNKKLRKFCAEELIKIGFDGYAYGGFPIKKGKLMTEMLEYVSKLIPNNKIKYAMGIGKPQDIIECRKIGYDLFDCVIPTRDARHKRLFVFTKKPNKKNLLNSFETINIRKKYCNQKKISKYCDCELCKKYTRKNFINLFKNDKEEAFRLATLHNLTFYSSLTKILKKKYIKY